MSSTLGILFDERFKRHLNPPGHPERPERLEAVVRAVASRAGRGAVALAACAAAEDDLALVHTAEYRAVIRSGHGHQVYLDPDTSMCSESYEVARLAAGSVVAAVDAVLGGEVGRACVFARPPGHHAEADRAMGFCLYNNVAIGAAHALERHGLGRVLVMDYDVHHGNGTQHIFEDSPHVLYISTHEFPLYPGTGALSEVGRGAGRGFTVNLPMPAGSGDAEYEQVFARVVVPIAIEFAPELVLVSAGFDAHAADPLAGMRMSANGFARITAMLRDLATAVCGGRLVLVLEGGYDLDALTDSVGAVLDVLLGSDPPPVTRSREESRDAPAARASMTGAPWPTRADTLIEQFLATHRRYWRSLQGS